MIKKLPAKHANRIADLILQISVGKQMIDDTKGNPERFRMWAEYVDNAQMGLREYGIDIGKTYAEIRADHEAEIARRLAA